MTAPDLPDTLRRAAQWLGLEEWQLHFEDTGQLVRDLVAHVTALQQQVEESTAAGMEIMVRVVPTVADTAIVSDRFGWTEVKRAVEALVDEAVRRHAALLKIDAIRNSIIGTQQINWSAHIYPLVAALGEAGYEGEGYEVAREKAETLLQQRDAAEHRLQALEAAIVDVAEELEYSASGVTPREHAVKLRAALTSAGQAKA